MALFRTFAASSRIVRDVLEDMPVQGQCKFGDELSVVVTFPVNSVQVSAEFVRMLHIDLFHPCIP